MPACNVLDIGTGSGCIAISLAKFLPVSEVEAWDISEGALLIAQRNSIRNEVKVLYRQLDVLKVVPEKRCYDVIVSNPPYITEKEKSEMESNVLDCSLQQLCLFRMMSLWFFIGKLQNWGWIC